MKTVLGAIIEAWADSKTSIDTLNNFDEIISEIMNDKESAIKDIKELEKTIQERLLDSGKCPECGAELPYDTDDIEMRRDYGLPIKCPECDWREC